MCSDYAEAVTLLRELADEYERRGEAGALAGAQRRLALVHELRGQWEAALTAREAAAVAFSAAGLRAEAAIDRLAVATHLRAAGSYSAALGTLVSAKADAESSGRPDLLLRAEGLRGNLLSRLGQSREGIAAVRAALDQALEGSLSDTAADLQQRLADSLEHAGQYRAATARLRRRLSVLRDARSRRRRPVVPCLRHRGAIHPRRMGPHRRRVRGRARVPRGAACPGRGRRHARPGARDAGRAAAGPSAPAGESPHRHPDRARADGAVLVVGAVRAGEFRGVVCRGRRPGPAGPDPAGPDAGTPLQRADPAVDGRLLRRAGNGRRRPRVRGRAGRDGRDHRPARGDRRARPRAGRDPAGR